jgi:hypothetical protein
MKGVDLGFAVPYKQFIFIGGGSDEKLCIYDIH